MRKKFTFWLAAMFLLAVTNMSAQITSEWIDPTPQGNDFADVEFVNETTGIAVTDGGAIVKSTDAGTTWTAVTPVTAENLTDICWVDENNVFVGGNNGTLLVSTDGGDTWMNKYMGMSLNVRKIAFTSASKGFAVGNSTEIYKTMDGGDSWESTGYDNTANIGSVFFLDADKGWVVGDNSTCAYTTDGGENWMPAMMDPLLVFTPVSLYDVFFLDASNGVIVGAGGTRVVSTDGGMTWAGIQTAIVDDLYSLVPGVDSLYATTQNTSGVVYATADGLNWEASIKTGPFILVSQGDSLLVRDGYLQGQIMDLAFAGSKMVAVGMGGATSVSEDYGATWTEMSHTVFQFGPWIQAIDFASDKMVGYAGTNGLKNYGFTNNHINPNIYKTMDGGNTWELLPNFDWGGASNFPITEMMVNPNDKDHVVAVGRKRCQWTRDGGETWYNTNDLYYKNGDSVAVKGGVGIAYNDNFGGQWVDDSTVVISSGQYVHISTDSARTWRPVIDLSVDTLLGLAENVMSACYFTDRYHGYVTARSGGLLKTEDGGETWVNMSDTIWTAVGGASGDDIGNIDIDPSNPDNMAMAFRTRAVLSTDDAGQSWTYTDFGGPNYNCLDVNYIGPGVIWSTGKSPHISFDNGKTWAELAMPGISSAKQTVVGYQYDENTFLEGGALSSKRIGASIIKHTFPTGYLTEKTSQATNVSFSNLTDSTQMTVNWSRGTGEACVVFVRVYNEADSLPTLSLFNGGYDASSAWGMGEMSSDGWYCVYDGTGSEVTVTDLPMDTMYTVFVSEYKTGYLYNPEMAEGNSATSPSFNVGIDKVEALKEFTIYPNPTTGEFSISASPVKAGMGQVKVMSLVGKVVDVRNVMFNPGVNRLTYDFSDQAIGMYLIELDINGNKSIGRIVKY